MLKRWFTPPNEEGSTPQNRPARNGSADHAEVAVADDPTPHALATSPNGSAASVPPGKYNPFEQIYQNAATKPPRIPYNILKIAEMVNSPHLGTMSPEAKRCSLLMALDAAGAAIEDVLQDAVIRQRALLDYEEAQRERLRHFEHTKAEENTKIQAELERLTNLHNARIQANLEEVAREQDNFRAWQKSKHLESQRITEAAAFCVPQGSPTGITSLAGVLERATLVHG